MFYDAIRNNHGLPHDPFKALVVPRPIGWISSIDTEGNVNLAPYSFFNAIAQRPNQVCFSSTAYKNSVANIDSTHEFVCNFVPPELCAAMIETSAAVPPGIDKMRVARLTPMPSKLVKPPRVAESPAALECRHLRTIELTDLDERPIGQYLVLGQVIGIYIDDNMISDGLVDVTKLKPVSRLGYFDYSVVTETFAMRLPKEKNVVEFVKMRDGSH